MTDFITNSHWSDIATSCHVLVDDAYRTLEHHFGQWPKRGTPPVFSASEVITLSWLAYTLCFITNFILDGA